MNCHTEVPWLRAVKVKTDGSLEGLNALEAQVDPKEFSEDSVVLIAQLLGLLAAFIGVVISIVGLILVRVFFLEKALNQFYQANLIARIDYADILYIAPILLFVGVAMAGVTGYVTLRLYVRR